jgi:xanthine dehydrogenase YagR molybdenum-binding subunit
MRDGDWLVGWGCATATYPSNIGPAAVRLSVTPEGKATIQLAGHEIGTGAYTVVAITAAHSLGLKVDDMTVKLGDSDLPPVTTAGGSNNAATTAHVVHKACEEVRVRVAAAASADAKSPLHGEDPTSLTLSGGRLVGSAGASEPPWPASPAASWRSTLRTRRKG